MLLGNCVKPGVLLFVLREWSKCSPAGHEVEDEHNNGKNQKNVNPSTHGVAADES
jgi:hypothetical protein